MPEKNKNNTGLRTFLLRTLADPVLLYTTLVMMALMFHYRDRTTTSEQLSEFAENMHDLRSSFVYGAVTYVIGWLIFRLFDFMQKHRITGFIGYAAVFFLFMQVTGYCTDRGAENYPISWGVWFLTPQDSLEFNRWYALAMYLLFLIFMLSVIYYFTRVRYRILMNFLIFIIPFAVYGKEYEKMPIGYIILMAVGYVLMMITFRQLNENSGTEVVSRRQTWISVGVYTVIFAVISAIVPKPAVEADRTMLETLISAEAFTDRLNAMLNVFRDTADGDQFRVDLSNAPVYYANAEEPLRIKTSTFSNYDYRTDSWSVSDTDDHYSDYDELPINIWINGGTADSVLLAAELDADFAHRFGLTDIAGETLYYPEEREVTFYTVQGGSNAAPVPQSARSLRDSSYHEQLDVMRSGSMYSHEGSFQPSSDFRFSYLPDGYFGDSRNREITDRLAAVEDYSSMLKEAYDIAYAAYQSDSGLDSRYSDRLYRNTCVLNYGSKFYDDYTSELLDYGGNQRIYQLAKEITAPYTSEYDKAKALEMYFYRNGYTYDLQYVKSQGENAEDFIFDTKTGVCYEYATAMTLLARAAGIPARYCEGYNMHQTYNRQGWSGYVVTNQDAHGFPELYLKGYGWLSFEPTLTDAASVQQRRGTVSSLSRAGLILLAAAVIALLLAIAWPVLSHKLFLLSSRRRSPGEQVRAVMKRLCRIYGVSGANTSHEAAGLVSAASGADISVTAALFDKAVYGGVELSESEGQKVTEEYTAAWEALRAARKEARRQRRHRTAH